MTEHGLDEEEEDEGEVVMDKEEKEAKVVLEEGKWEKVWIIVGEVEVGGGRFLSKWKWRMFQGNRWRGAVQ